MKRKSLREEIRLHDRRVKEIRESLRLGNLYNQHESARRMGDHVREGELVGKILRELMNLELAKAEDDTVYVLSLKTGLWKTIHDPIWGIVNYASQVILKEVTRVLSLERAARLLLKGKKIKSHFKDDI